MTKRKKSDPHAKRVTGNAAPAVPVVLVVDDEADIVELLELTLTRMGLEVKSAMSVQAAKALLAAHHFDLCLTDMRLPDGEGLDLVQHIDSHIADLPVAVITAHGNTENAVAALKAGAFDYLAKPVSLLQLRTLVKSALKLPSGVADAASIPAAGTLAAAGIEAAPGDMQIMLGASPAMLQARAMIDKLARSQAPVYISGESGSGKERAARLIHQKSARGAGPFVPVNCGAISENLMESEFFGYKKGAFTGADHDRDGFFQAAEGGTLFLDEVADLPLAMQVKLLRAIQEKRVRPVGATGETDSDVRIICATHKNLSSAVESGKFRQDLYYRLNVIELKMPSLREMPQDIPFIADTFLARMCAAQGIAPRRLSRDAQRALARYGFPGNVRELENILERAIALSAGAEVDVDDLQLTPPMKMEQFSPAANASDKMGETQVGADNSKAPLQDYLDRLEKTAIQEALERTRYNRTAAAKLLGITFRSLRYRIARLGLDEE